ncbi:hypothetical protein FGO68_gene15388 [Halteria grandinella]|uniref:THAP4-like heme-binding domain-containing protein n=1 Tax=Halteria grandinella TaxID=5974 RepID=A0A8J8NBW6_HALGN|nr:hypothetical protein FGO68_gene15388 [Halteria grandinella]
MDTAKPSDKLVFFQGSWKGQGKVLEKPVAYDESLTFTLCRSDPAIVLSVQQFTKHSELGIPLHAENGFIKIYGPPLDAEGTRRVEATFSHPFSLQEVEEGTFDGKRMVLEAKQFQRGPTAKGKQTTAFRREYWINESGDLCYKMFLGVDGAEAFEHLNGELKQV